MPLLDLAVRVLGVGADDERDLRRPRRRRRPRLDLRPRRARPADRRDGRTRRATARTSARTETFEESRPVKCRSTKKLYHTPHPRADEPPVIPRASRAGIFGITKKSLPLPPPPHLGSRPEKMQNIFLGVIVYPASSARSSSSRTKSRLRSTAAATTSGRAREAGGMSLTRGDGTARKATDTFR